MRGHYYSDRDRATLEILGWKLPARETVQVTETEEDRNARENAAKPYWDRPHVFGSPETPSTGADIRAIVQYVALRVLLNDLDYHGLQSLVSNYHAELQGITEAQVRQAIAEGLE